MIELYNKYNVVHINGCRYYLIDLSKKEFNFENTLPYCFVIDGVTIFDSSWKGIILKIAEELDHISPKSKEELLSLQNSWGKQEVFGRVKKANYQQFKSIYINTNHSAVHAMWTVQLLLAEYNINLEKCQFILKRLPLAEPKEIREYEKAKTLEGFRTFLREEHSASDTSIQNIIKIIEVINARLLSHISKGYYDLFLIENPTCFSGYSKKSLEYAKNRLGFRPDQLKLMQMSADYLAAYLKKQIKENKIQFDTYEILKDTNSDDDLDDFDEF